MAEQLRKWPDWMKCALARGFEVQVDEMRVKSDTDAGSLIRVDFPNVDKSTATGELLLDGLQANAFEAFERDILVQGSKWFLFPLWVGGQIIAHEVRMKERLSWGQKEGGYTYYAFTLEVGRRLGLMDEELYDWLEENDPYEFIESTKKLDWLADRLHIIMCRRLPETMIPIWERI